MVLMLMGLRNVNVMVLMVMGCLCVEIGYYLIKVVMDIAEGLYCLLMVEMTLLKIGQIGYCLAFDLHVVDMRSYLFYYFLILFMFVCCSA